MCIDDITMMTKHGFQPIRKLMLTAFQNGDVDSMKKLLSSGESPNAIIMDQDGKQQSLLIKTLSRKNYRMASLLLDHGADTATIFKNYDPLNKTICQTSALMTARHLYTTDKNKLLKEILQKIEGNSKETQESHVILPENLPNSIPPKVLLDAVREGDLISTKFLLSEGMDVDQLYKNFGTGYQVSVLILSISSKQLHITKYLLQHGARPDFIFLNYDEDKEETYQVTAMSTATDLLSKEKSEGVGEIIDLIQRKLQDLGQCEPTTVIAPNVPTELQPANRPSSRLFLPRESVFQIPQILIDTASDAGLSEEDHQYYEEEQSQKKEKKHFRKSKKIPKKEKNGAIKNGTDEKDGNKGLKKNKKSNKSEVCVIL